MLVEQLVDRESPVGGAEGRLYALRKGVNQVTLNLHRQALRRMETLYKFLVHLMGDRTEELMVQADFIPHGSTYYTTSYSWEAEGFVSDEVLLSRQDIPPAMYRLGVGVYDGDSGPRLPLTDGAELRQLCDRRVLPDAAEKR